MFLMMIVGDEVNKAAITRYTTDDLQSPTHTALIVSLESHSHTEGLTVSQSSSQARASI